MSFLVQRPESPMPLNWNFQHDRSKKSSPSNSATPLQRQIVVDRKNVFSHIQKIAVVSGNAMEKRARICFSGVIPVVQFDNDQGSSCDPFGVSGEEIVFSAFDVDFYDERKTIFRVCFVNIVDRDAFHRLVRLLGTTYC